MATGETGKMDTQIQQTMAGRTQSISHQIRETDANDGRINTYLELQLNASSIQCKLHEFRSHFCDKHVLRGKFDGLGVSLCVCVVSKHHVKSQPVPARKRLCSSTSRSFCTALGS